jgi:hypothetical protein
MEWNNARSFRARVLKNISEMEETINSPSVYLYHVKPTEKVSKAKNKEKYQILIAPTTIDHKGRR